MAGESGGRVGSGAPRREQDSRDKRIEELQRENAKLIDDLDRTTRDLDRTTRDLDRTTRDLDRTTRYRDRWKRRSEDLKNNSMKPAAPANGRLHPLPSTGRKGPASGPADGPGRSTVGKGPDFARRTSTRSTERRRQGRARTAVGRRSDPRRLAVSGRTSPGPPHRTPLRHRGRSLLAVPPAGAGAPSSRDLRRPWGGRGAARPRPRLARRRVAHRDACAAGQGCRPPADEARPGGHRWRPRSSAASNRPRRRASPTGNSAGKSATRRWSRPTKRAGASASSPTGCGRSSPRRPPSTPSAPAAGSRMRPPCSGPTTAAWLCATAGGCTGATRVRCARVASITCFSVARNWSRSTPTVLGARWSRPLQTGLDLRDRGTAS